MGHGTARFEVWKGTLWCNSVVTVVGAFHIWNARSHASLAYNGSSTIDTDHFAHSRVQAINFFAIDSFNSQAVTGKGTLNSVSWQILGWVTSDCDCQCHESKRRDLAYRYCHRQKA